DDVRITTRIDETDPFNCLYSTIHEVGHATYEAGINKAYRLTPIGSGVSMGVHESQSRLYENQLGRSRPFATWLHGRMQELFGDAGTRDPAVFYAGVNRLRQNPIRTDADEVQYNLHIILRFQIERQLINGVMPVQDVSDVWNERFLEMFGFPIDRPSHGFLQDVHWSAGYFGYFPTYTLGNLYAACLHQALRDAVPTLDDSLARGDPSPATRWLRESLQQFGGLRSPRDTIETACGFRISERPLLQALEAKFLEIYNL
ncbi:MAG: carboxypeptidase M32, partial [Rhodobacteraceae bacterium]|nr:carboxypeptidase M32 [Paracoccaceae bacterium]